MFNLNEFDGWCGIKNIQLIRKYSLLLDKNKWFGKRNIIEFFKCDLENIAVKFSLIWAEEEYQIARRTSGRSRQE